MANTDNCEIDKICHRPRGGRAESSQNSPTVDVKGNTLANSLSWLEYYLMSLFDSAPESIPAVVRVVTDDTLSGDSEISDICEGRHRCGSVKSQTIAASRPKSQITCEVEENSSTLSNTSMSETVLIWMSDMYPDVVDEASYSLLHIPARPSFDASSFLQEEDTDLPTKSAKERSFNKSGYEPFESVVDGKRTCVRRDNSNRCASYCCKKTYSLEQSMESTFSFKKGTGDTVKRRSVQTKCITRKRRSMSNNNTHEIRSVIHKGETDLSQFHVPGSIDTRSSGRYGYV